MAIPDPGYWSANWLWGLPLIILSVLVHSSGLFAAHDPILVALTRKGDWRRSKVRYTLVFGATILFVTALHAGEAAAWAGAYERLGALPDGKSAMLYSLEAMTSYGHTNIVLAPHWRMMGALEALCGMIMFGLTTAFLFSLMQAASRTRPRPVDDHRPIRSAH